MDTYFDDQFDYDDSEPYIWFKYNNEYYCYDLTKSKTTFFQLDDDTFDIQHIVDEELINKLTSELYKSVGIEFD